MTDNGRSEAVMPLNRDSHSVQAAREAERAAYDYYGVDYQSHQIDVGGLGLQMRVLEVGSGPPVVLIPGGEGINVTWLPLLPQLEGRTAYVMDRPGGGLSDGIDFLSIPLRQAAEHSTLALFEHVGIDSAPVVGNSMGGLWALRFALAHPDRVSQLSFMGCPAVYPGTSAPLPMRIGSIPGLSGIVAERLIQPSSAADARAAIEFLGHPPQTVERVPQRLTEAWYRLNDLPHYRQTWVGILRTVLRLRGANPQNAFTYEDLAAISAPVQLIWGSEDPFGSVDAGRRGAEHFADAEFTEIGVGHLPWLDEPEQCGAQLEEFLDRGE